MKQPIRPNEVFLWESFLALFLENINVMELLTYVLTALGGGVAWFAKTRLENKESEEEADQKFIKVMMERQSIIEEANDKLRAENGNLRERVGTLSAECLSKADKISKLEAEIAGLRK